MRLAKVISFLGILAMTGVIMWAFISGDFASEGAKLLAMPWGIVSMVDLYVGFIIFTMWIVYREKAVLPSIFWVFFMLTLGFFTGSLYVFIALQRSGGSWQKFWHGNRKMPN
ncbi:MAG: DUF1475 domain-containing protein [Chloroflexi bacterium HGW-Chloroflexi-4]|jgi:hypothetical protein|nr:MAG: DUF1475 domain-containing protein [Chloroflexi bacterium HGW-Chloroflexi-4]